MNDDPIKMTDVLKKARVPKHLHEQKMNQIRRLVGDMMIWPNGIGYLMFRYDHCKNYNVAKVVYIRRGDVQRVLEAVGFNEDLLLGSTNE